ncbi:amidohydrolase family protein [Neobacillus sp. DY30]|uniref:amidohydrolase n=1 Tax=Neobacillus sp. DY30 TaxID=3047871 RepID=UPI0024BF9727|nr:amidohydrolase family protein [Neobacillus sp. DY30]WHY01315.1 amidohydrolase family protein [Neobacillus sp. DY30]
MSKAQMNANIVIVSNVIFSGLDEKTFAGYIAIKDNKIAAVGKQNEKDQWIGPETKVYELGNQLVMPGIHDNHVFFTGYMSMNRGVDLSKVSSVDEATTLLIQHSMTLGPKENVYGFGWDKESLGCIPEQHLLDEIFPNTPVFAINRTKSWCWMNQKAIEKYKFTPDQCSAEDRAALLKDMLQEREEVKQEFLDFCQLLAARGVTSIKDIGFDRYELLSILTELADEGKLPLRVHFALEPVMEPLNIKVGKSYQKRYQDDFLRFQGFKIMVDGVVADHTGDMLEPYADMPDVKNLRSVNYEKIETWVLEADRNGLKCCLTAEGDAAIRQAVTFLEKCREVNGKRDARHSISDLEYPHPSDLKRMGENEIFAEIYAQILLLNPSYEESYMAAVVGKEKEKHFYDYRAMLEAGISITAGTDLPLFITSVPDSIYATAMRLFPDGSPWYPELGLPIAEILKAWTINGARHNFMEDKTGTIEVGKYADIAVFDRNLFESSASEIRNAKVVLTVMNGDIVHDITLAGILA